MQRIAPKKQDELRCSNEPEGTGGSVVQKTKSIVVFI
jgi:hypothetical protein